MIGARRAVLSEPPVNYDPNSYGTFSIENNSEIRLPIAYDIVGHSFSVETKVRLNAWRSGDHTFLGQKDPYGYLQTLHILARDMRPHFGFYGNDYNAGGDQLTTGVWYRLVYMYDHDDPKRKIIYRDGQYLGEAGSGALTGTQRLYIGSWGNGRQFVGDMMYLRIWNKVLTPSEITAYDNKKIGHSIPGLEVSYNMSYWLNGDGNERVQDYSGNGWDAMPDGTVIWNSL